MRALVYPMMLSRIFLVPSSVSTGPEGKARAMGSGSQLPWRPFACTTGLSPLQISIRRGSRLASDCPCQILPEGPLCPDISYSGDLQRARTTPFEDRTASTVATSLRRALVPKPDQPTHKT